MGWFWALETPTQVAIVGVLTALVAAVATVTVAVINNRKAGGGKAEIAALTVDASSIKMVAAALEGVNLTMVEQNKLGEKLILVIVGFTEEVEELRREVRVLSDKMRG